MCREDKLSIDRKEFTVSRDPSNLHLCGKKILLIATYVSYGSLVHLTPYQTETFGSYVLSRSHLFFNELLVQFVCITAGIIEY
jgi:hypothetical protein